MLIEWHTHVFKQLLLLLTDTVTKKYKNTYISPRFNSQKEILYATSVWRCVSSFDTQVWHKEIYFITKYEFKTVFLQIALKWE